MRFLKHGFDLSDSTTAKAGVSYLHGPNFTGEDSFTDIYGFDFKIRWKSDDYAKSGKDVNILLLIVFTVLTQEIFDLKSVTQLSSTPCH